MTLCKRCKKEFKFSDMPKGYSICFDCLIHLDINHKDFSKYLLTRIIKD